MMFQIKRREKLKLSLKGFQGPLAPAKGPPAFEAYALISSIYLDRVQSRRINRREKLKLSLKG